MLGLAGDDVEIADDGDASEVDQVLAGAAVAGAAALPVPDVGEGVLDLNARDESTGRARAGHSDTVPSSMDAARLPRASAIDIWMSR